MKARLRKISLLVILFIFALVPLAANAQGPEGIPPENVIRAEPVHGVTIGPGKKLWVFVFPERGKGKPGPAPDCTDGDQALYALLGFKLPPTLVPFNINYGSIPIDKNAAVTAITNSFTTWGNAVGKSLFAVNSTGGASGPAADGNNTVGWVGIVPTYVLAGAWIWTTDINGVETVTDADIFYNLFSKWGVFSVCNAQSKFEVQNVGTHEVGHVVGLGHVSDPGAMATMYPSAPKGEVKKQTLTTGDINGAIAVTP